MSESIPTVDVDFNSVAPEFAFNQYLKAPKPERFKSFAELKEVYDRRLEAPAKD